MQKIKDQEMKNGIERLLMMENKNVVCSDIYGKLVYNMLIILSNQLPISL